MLTATDTGTSLFALAPNSELMIGARDAGNTAYGNFFTGTIYDVRVYNYPLTQSQVVNDGRVPPPITAAVVAPGQLQLTWPFGTLLEATNLLGPWTTNSYVSPALIDTTAGPQKFFRVKIP